MAPQTLNPNDPRHWKDELVKIDRDRSNFHVSPGYQLEIRSLSMEHPLKWLSQGWRDLRRNPVIAIAYGALIAVVFALIVASAMVTQLYHVGVQLTAGFIVLAPMMALGFYGISRKVERGESVTFRDVFSVWRQNNRALLAMGMLLMLLFLVWFMASMWTTVLLSASTEAVALLLAAESLTEFYWILTTSITLPMMLGYLLVGVVAALVAFAFTAVSIPMLMDHTETDAITALTMSWKAVILNWKPMLWWAVLIAFFTAIGLALFYVGLAITMPLLGFATWHAYRDTLGPWRKVEEPKPPYY